MPNFVRIGDALVNLDTVSVFIPSKENRLSKLSVIYINGQQIDIEVAREETSIHVIERMDTGLRLRGIEPELEKLRAEMEEVEKAKELEKFNAMKARAERAEEVEKEDAVMKALTQKIIAENRRASSEDELHE